MRSAGSARSLRPDPTYYNALGDSTPDSRPSPASVSLSSRKSGRDPPRRHTVSSSPRDYFFAQPPLLSRTLALGNDRATARRQHSSSLHTKNASHELLIHHNVGLRGSIFFSAKQFLSGSVKKLWGGGGYINIEGKPLAFFFIGARFATPEVSK